MTEREGTKFGRGYLFPANPFLDRRTLWLLGAVGLLGLILAVLGWVLLPALFYYRPFFDALAAVGTTVAAVTLIPVLVVTLWAVLGSFVAE